MAETRKNACPDCGGALDHWRGSVACEEYKVRTDQTAQLKHPEEDRYAIDTPEAAQGEAGGAWECWTCMVPPADAGPFDDGRRISTPCCSREVATLHVELGHDVRQAK